MVWGEVYGESVTQSSPPISIWIFYHLPNVQSSFSFFLDFFQRELLCLFADNCLWELVWAGASYVAIMDLNSVCTFFEVDKGTEPN